GLTIMAVMLVTFTLATLMLQWQKPAAAWPALLIAYVVVGFCWYGNHSIVKFNLNAQKGRRRYAGNTPCSRNLDFCRACGHGHFVPDQRDGQDLSESGTARGTDRLWPGRNPRRRRPRHD